MSAMRPDYSKQYSYLDYLKWSGDARLELIDGIPYMMTPAPSRLHQEILLELGRQFSNLLKGKKCKPFIAPFDVRLPENGERHEKDIYTVVQPDLVIVCDPTKLDDRGCIGAPDLIIEVLSKSTASHDYIRKMALYEKVKVKEYWIVHPNEQLVMVYKLEQNGKYGKPKVYDKNEQVMVEVVLGIKIELSEVFENFDQ